MRNGEAKDDEQMQDCDADGAYEDRVTREDQEDVGRRAR